MKERVYAILKDFLAQESTLAFLEGLKEVFRLALFAAVVESVSYLIEVIVGSQLDPLVKLALLAFLRSLDKSIHQYGKETGKEEFKTGLTRF